jgi:hypothetical protein
MRPLKETGRRSVHTTSQFGEDEVDAGRAVVFQQIQESLALVQLREVNLVGEEADGEKNLLFGVAVSDEVLAILPGRTTFLCFALP